MQKNSIANKITPCCSLPFSVIYWWVSNLTLKSESDRQYIISKISQNGTLRNDGWKVLINSGTLEADASFTKAEFLTWFDCERQPSCEQLKLIIEGFVLGNWKPEILWERPSDWLPMPTKITSADQIFVALHAVFESSQNYCSFSFTTSKGQYQVDWGDGTVTLHNSNTVAEKNYDYASISNSTLCSRGYKQVIIKVTPVSGNLLSCNFQQRFYTSPAQNQAYTTGFLDCILSMPNANAGQSITFGGTTIRHSYVERFDVKTIGNVTNMSGMFINCVSLQSVPLFNTQNVTNMSGMFINCYSLQSVPLFNTQNVTNMSGMFQGCYSLQSVPLFNTQNVTNMNSMFNSCFSLQSVPLFNTQNVTNMNSMFINCYSLQSVPLFNTQNVTNMNSMFINCYSLQSVPLFNTQNVNNMDSMFQGCYSLNFIPNFNTTLVTNFTTFASRCNSLDRCTTIFRNSVGLQNCQLSKDALVEIFTNLIDRTLTTSATIDITGNWGASALKSADRLIATNKNWIITG